MDRLKTIRDSILILAGVSITFFIVIAGFEHMDNTSREQALKNVEVRQAYQDLENNRIEQRIKSCRDQGLTPTVVYSGWTGTNVNCQ